MIRSRAVRDSGYEAEFTGLVTSAEMFEIGEDFRRQPDFGNLRYVLLIFTEIEDMILETAEVKRLAELDRRLSQQNPDLLFAIATDSPLVFGLARMWEAYYGDGPWQPRIFKTIAEARQWLNPDEAID